MADGYLEKCKECHKERIRTRRLTHGEYYRAYDRKRASDPDRVASRKRYVQSPSGKAITDEGKRRWDNKNKDKKRAHVKVSRALRRGILTKAPCEICGDPNVEGHHSDYARPLQVQWLCTMHHAALHKAQRDLPMDIPKPKSKRWTD